MALLTECVLQSPSNARLKRTPAFILRKRTWQSNPAHALFLQQYWDCGNNAWQEDIGDRHRAGVAAWLYRRAETAKEQAGWSERVGNFAINPRPGLRGSGRDACLQFRPRTLGDPWRHLGLRSWTTLRSGKSGRPGRQDSTGSYRA